MKKALRGCRNHRRSYLVAGGDAPEESGTGDPLPMPSACEDECHGWSCLELLWDQSSGLKSLKSFSWCISKTCRCWGTLLHVDSFMSHSFVCCHPSAKWYPQWSQVCRGSFDKTMWKAPLLISSLSTVTSGFSRTFFSFLLLWASFYCHSLEIFHLGGKISSALSC